MATRIGNRRPDAVAEEWIEAPAASVILGTNTTRVRRLADDGHIATRQLPGGRRYFSRRSCEELLARSISHAG